MRVPRKQRAAEDFQMAPMIDMVFLLLVFFMCVSSLVQADRFQVELDLPESTESTVPEDLSGRGAISVDEDGTLYTHRGETDLDSMREQIRADLRQEPELQIHLRADEATPFEVIRRVLSACAEAGAMEIIYATHQAD